jgi:hypothetical protein
MLCGLAVRIAQSIGLHRQIPVNSDLPDVEIRLRSQIWWVAYTLDTSVFLPPSKGTDINVLETDLSPHRREDHLLQMIATVTWNCFHYFQIQVPRLNT